MPVAIDRQRWALWLAGVAGSLALVVSAWPQRELLGGLSVDDAYITFRYARNWARGAGPVFNLGEPVEGYSNFLWLCLLTLHAKLGGASFDVAAQALGTLASLGSVLLAPWVLARVFGVVDTASLVGAALLVGTSGYVAAWAVGGLEGPLYGLLLLGATWAFARERAAASFAPWTGALCVLLALTRPEGQLVALATGGLYVVERRRAGAALRSARTLAMPLAVVVSLVAYHAFRFAYYGPHLWPNSVRAKVGATPEQLVRGLVHVADTFLHPYAPLLVGALVLVRRDRSASSWWAGGVVLGSLGVVALAGGDWSPGRLTAPLVPVLAVAGVAGFARLRDRIAARGLRAAAVLGFTAYVAAAGLVTNAREHGFRVLYGPVDRQRVRIGRWLAEHAPRDTVIAVTGAGQIPFYSDLYTHDLFGLNDAHIAGLPPPPVRHGLAGHEKYDVRYSVDVVKPDVVVGAQYVPGLVTALAETKRYALVPLPREPVLVRKGLFSEDAIERLVAE